MKSLLVLFCVCSVFTVPIVSSSKKLHGANNDICAGYKAAANGVRPPSMPGGFVCLEVNQQIQDLSWRAVNKGINEQGNDFFHRIPLKVLSARSQVVAGTLYKLNILVGTSKCRKNRVSYDQVTGGNCLLQRSGRFEECQISIWRQPWKPDFEQITVDHCNRVPTPQKYKRSRNVAHNKHKKHGQHGYGQLKQKDAKHWQEFQDFMKTHNRTYTGGKREVLKRFRVYKRNLKLIQWIQLREQGTAKYGPTKFSDMSPREFRKVMLTPVWRDVGYPTRFAQIPSTDGLPTEFDWRTRGAVTPVKNQGYCGSCWAFSVTGNIEGAWHRKTGHLLSLSEQELVDCDRLDQGCGGGLPANAYKEIIRMGGLEDEHDYPYEARAEKKCNLEKREVQVYINDSVKISPDEKQMAAWLVKNGPISIGINAFWMQFYWYGISHPWKIFCNPKSLDHGVLIVGYGVKGDKPYWIIKNSWGPNWGEHGYYYLYRGKGVCGVNQMATSAIVD